jgi:hypothetical protein
MGAKVDHRHSIAGICGVLLVAFGVSAVRASIPDKSLAGGAGWIVGLGFAVFGGMIIGAAISKSAYDRKQVLKAAKEA